MDFSGSFQLKVGTSKSHSLRARQRFSTHSDVTCAYVAERRQSSAARLAGARAARGVHVRARRRRATGACAPFCLRRVPTLPRAEAVVRGHERFRAARGASTPDWGAREGLRGTPERPRARDTSRSRLRRGSRPVEGAAVSGRGFPNSKQIWIEFGSNSERRDRREIEEGRSERRSTESWPILARLVRRPGLATRLGRFLKPLNYIA